MNCKTVLFALAVLTSLMGIATALAQDPWIEPRCTLLPLASPGPFARLGDGGVLLIEDNATRISRDGGRSWSAPQAIYGGGKPGIPSGACVLVRTRSGALVLVYGDMST
jgi:hypothetical protein